MTWTSDRSGTAPPDHVPPRTAAWPIEIDDVEAAAQRLRPYLLPTPLRHYPVLDAAVGHGIQVLVKHENHQPTNAFKIRNALAALTALEPHERASGIVAASRGNHGMALAHAGQILGVPVTICVPEGNNPEKNEAIRGLGAALVIQGEDYDESILVAEELVRSRGLTLIHATNRRGVLAGAGTLTLEIVAAGIEFDAMVVAVGGGSQAVGGMAVLRPLRPAARVYGVQAAGAAALHDSWHAGIPRPSKSAQTFADGIATRAIYEMTFPALLDGLAGFVTVTEAEIAAALRLILRTTHNLVEGAGAAGLAGLVKLREELAGNKVVVVLSGGNIDQRTLRWVLAEAESSSVP